MSQQWSLMQIAMIALPIAIGLIAVFIGSKQAREFHRRTGDNSVLSHLAGLSWYQREPKSEASRPKRSRT